MRRPRPLRRFNIPLRERQHVTCVIWRHLADLHDGTPCETVKDYSAIFEEIPQGPCIGRVHIHRSTPPEDIAHEFRHAIDFFNYRQHTERSAQMTENCLATVSAVMEDL